MYKNVMVPVALDHGARSQGALDLGRQLAGDGGKVIVLHVLEEVPSYAAVHLPDGIFQRNREISLSELGELKGADAANVSVEVVRGHASRTILDYAQDHGVDCIVMASHKPGLEDYFLGSTAAHVVRHAECSVHVIR